MDSFQIHRILYFYNCHMARVFFPSAGQNGYVLLSVAGVGGSMLKERGGTSGNDGETTGGDRMKIDWAYFRNG
jgi:hypothetical protein